MLDVFQNFLCQEQRYKNSLNCRSKEHQDSGKERRSQVERFQWQSEKRLIELMFINSSFKIDYKLWK